MTYYLEKSEWWNSLNVPEGMNLDMVNMEGRLENIFKPALEEEAQDKVVIDLGCGTGMIGIYALEQGAKFVYFVEQNSQMIHILNKVLTKKIDRSKFKIIHKDIENLKVEDFDRGKPDLCVGEFFGPRLFDEGYVMYTRHLNKLFPTINFIPERFEGKFSIVDIDYSTEIWPKEKILIDHFKFMYSEKGFAKSMTKPSEKEFIATIDFDANTGVFNNNFTFKYNFQKEKLLIGEMNAVHRWRVHNYVDIGWVMTEDDYDKNIKILIDELNYFNPRKIIE
jgi:predicted RNA methylase